MEYEDCKYIITYNSNGSLVSVERDTEQEALIFANGVKLSKPVIYKVSKMLL